ncbi:hypothetical protein M2197_006442 [Bradyrhizobium japonicum]|nr:hypothetical protein CF64_12070 [Bradyrhizobium japonicum]BAL10566.1 hypothetical protein BJ6T_53060 [Bradyrhizobium japonicum USDA 6]MCS3539990.1 hypothetical protein [Bradyrhizobium japonicum]MCS3992807.1 hypothetical protein [Bradyrhizobium japonicum]MCS4021261.1 hypothetical protein [Bradyrhizobium japonicum]
MPDQRKVDQVDPHYSSDIRAEAVASSPSDRSDIYVVLGDQHAHVEVRVENEYSLAAYMPPSD